ncbi:MAG: autotransporter outer membrane beta-barrel domain-containing protein, partial [Rhizobiaceae bacterium]
MTSARSVTLNAGRGVFQTNASLELTGTISGDGKLTKTGAGALRLSSANNYGGGTTVSQGLLTATVAGALGTGPVTVHENGGAELRFTGTANSDGLAIDVVGGPNSVVTFRNNASAGTATIDNGGRIFWYDAASAGSATIESEGGLSFNGGSTAGTSKITIAGSGRLEFHGAASAGSATVTNNGGVSFHGDNTADAATIVNQTGGTVDISDLISGGIGIGSLSGDGRVILGSKILTLGNLGTNDTIGGVIQDGTAGNGGSLVKTGTGTLTLNGVNTFTGGTTVNAGKLVVGDSSHAGASLGDVALAMGGTLGGIGTIGNTTIGSGGALAPGNSIGTINVAGNVTFTAGSVYEVEIDADGRSDKTVASGTATINGGTVKVLAGAGSYASQTGYLILSAAGGVVRNGDFGLSSNLAFLTPSLSYGIPNEVWLTMTRNDVDFGSVGRTPNQKAAGTGVESTDPGSPIYNTIAGLSADQARAAFDGLSGEIHASAKSALMEDSRFLRDAVNERIRAAFAGVGAAASPVLAYGETGTDGTATGAISHALAPADTGRLAAWGSVFGSWGSTDGDGNAAGLDRSTGGFFTGIDGLVADNVRLGIMTGYSHSSFDVDGRASSGSSDSYHLGLYGGTEMGALGLRSGLAYSWHDISTARSVAFPGFADSLSADYNAGTFQAFGEAGYRIDTASASFEPFANLAYVSLHTDSFAEKGGAAALTSAGQTTDTTFTTLGVRASTGFDLGGMTATARGMVGWRHAFGDTTPLATPAFAFAGANSFTIAGVPIAKDAAVLEAGLDFAISDRATLGLSYSGQFGSNATDNGAKA